MGVAAFGCDDDRLARLPDPIDLGTASSQKDSGISPDVSGQDNGFLEVGSPDVGVPPASEAMYIHTGNTLFSYEPAGHRTRRIGQFTGDSGPLKHAMVDIAIDQTGALYGGTGTSRDPKRIYLIDPSTARCTFLFEVDDNLNGMAFDGQGRLIAAGESLRILDLQSGHTLLTFQEAGMRFTTSGDVVGLPDGNIYWTVRGEERNAPDRLVRLDPRSGHPTLLGSLSQENLFGLGYANGELFGFSTSGQVVVIDPETGEVIADRELKGRWFGATANPVIWR